MKRSPLFCFMLCVMVFLAALPSHGQDRGEDLADIYKGYFKLIIDKDFAGAWDGLTDESKAVISSLISSEAGVPAAKILEMLDGNENDLRDKYFGAFRESIRELLDEIYSTGTYTLRSIRGDDAVVTIEVRKDPKDFRMVRKNGKWRVNFFKDLEETDQAP